MSEVALRRNIMRSLIHNWRRQEVASLLGATVGFTPVTVETEMPRAIEAAPKMEVGGWIEIELPGGASGARRARARGTATMAGYDPTPGAETIRACRRHPLRPLTLEAALSPL